MKTKAAVLREVGKDWEIIELKLDPRPAYCNYGYQYWRQLADGRLVIGGDTVRFDQVAFVPSSDSIAIASSLGDGRAPAGVARRRSRKSAAATTAASVAIGQATFSFEASHQ